jgi:hypothetical protein
MKTIFVAHKSSYGSGFFKECNTLDELKRAIVYHEIGRWGEGYTPEMYTEELFKKHSTDYRLYEVNLHDDECIEWDEYDGTSSFNIEKKDRNIFSTTNRIKD